MGKQIIAPLVIALLVIIVGLLAYPHYQSYKARNEAERAATRAPKPDGRNKVVIPAGEEGRLATLALTVEEVEEVSTLKDVFGTTEANEDSIFILVDTSFTNLSNETFTLYPEGIFLVDKNGVKYDVYHASSGGAIGVEEKAIDGRDLGNGIKERGVIVYEVSKNFQPYALQIEKAGTNDTLLFELSK